MYKAQNEVRFSWVLLDINSNGLFNDKPCLYKYIDIVFGSEYFEVTSFLKEPELICLQTNNFKYFYLLLTHS